MKRLTLSDPDRRLMAGHPPRSAAAPAPLGHDQRTTAAYRPTGAVTDSELPVLARCHRMDGRRYRTSAVRPPARTPFGLVVRFDCRIKDLFDPELGEETVDE